MHKLSKLLDYFKKIPKDFWGTIEIRFKDGKPVSIKEHRQIKLDSERQKQL